MVTVYGMSEKLGPISLEDKENLEVFGQDIEDVIGIEVKTLIDEAYKKATNILTKNIDKLETLAILLLQKEIVTAEEFEEIFE